MEEDTNFRDWVKFSFSRWPFKNSINIKNRTNIQSNTNRYIWNFVFVFTYALKDCIFYFIKPYKDLPSDRIAG